MSPSSSATVLEQDVKRSTRYLHVEDIVVELPLTPAGLRLLVSIPVVSVDVDDLRGGRAEGEQGIKSVTRYYLTQVIR